MTLTISHQDRYSRGQLILRFFLGLWSAILSFVTFWVVLFTAHFPKGIFDYQIKLNRWGIRMEAALMNLVDGYPPFGLDAVSDKVAFDVPRPERVSRGLTILRVLFGAFYVGIPHGVCLLVRAIASLVLMIVAWFAVLFTGKYPAKMHEFIVGTCRWSLRVNLYLGYFTDAYPAFSGKP